MSDPFSLEDSLVYELKVKSIAYAQGVNEGARRAIEEGRTAGLVRGWQAGADLGIARSISTFVLAMAESLESSSMSVSTNSNLSIDEKSTTKRESTIIRALRIAEQLRDSSNLHRPLKNNLDEDLVNDIQRLRAKSLVLGAITQLPAAIDDHNQAATTGPGSSSSVTSSSSSSSSSLLSSSSSLLPSLSTVSLSF
jgi:hypothetical protein